MPEFIPIYNNPREECRYCAAVKRYSRVFAKKGIFSHECMAPFPRVTCYPARHYAWCADFVSAKKCPFYKGSLVFVKRFKIALQNVRIKTDRAMAFPFLGLVKYLRERYGYKVIDIKEPLLEVIEGYGFERMGRIKSKQMRKQGKVWFKRESR